MPALICGFGAGNVIRMYENRISRLLQNKTMLLWTVCQASLANPKFSVLIFRKNERCLRAWLAGNLEADSHL